MNCEQGTIGRPYRAGCQNERLAVVNVDLPGRLVVQVAGSVGGRTDNHGETDIVEGSAVNGVPR